MLSDGDSKLRYKELVTSKVFGEEKLVQNEVCINHDAKRMGTALNNVEPEAKAQGSSVSGKGKLTIEKIIKIQNYYWRAVKDNAGDIVLKKKRIFST